MSEPFNSFAGSNSGRLQSDLSRLASKDSRPQKTLQDRSAAAPIPASVGSARPKPATASQQSAGIASPLTESPGTREHHPNQTLTSSDGLFTLQYQSPSKIAFTAANGGAVDLLFVDQP